VTSIVEKQGRRDISMILKENAGSVKNYDIDSEFVNILVSTIAQGSQNVGEFAYNLGDLAVYIGQTVSTMEGSSLKNSKLVIRKDPGVFDKRLKEQCYLPKVLAFLDQKEKYPEIFDDDRVKDETKYKTNRIFEVKIKQFVTAFVESIYAIDNPGERDFSHYVPDPGVEDRLPNYRPSSIRACVNADSVENIPDEQLVYYKDDDDNTYCLVIPELWLRFETSNFANPNTNKNLNPNWIENFQRTYRNPHKQLAFYVDDEGNSYNLDVADTRERFSDNDYTNPHTGNQINKWWINRFNRDYNSDSGIDIENDGFYNQQMTYFVDEYGNPFNLDTQLIKERFANNDYRNPATGVMFTNAWIERFHQKQMVIKQPEVISEPTKPLEIIAPNLLSLMLTLIKELEEEQQEEEEKEQEQEEEEEEKEQEQNVSDDIEEAKPVWEFNIESLGSEAPMEENRVKKTVRPTKRQPFENEGAEGEEGVTTGIKDGLLKGGMQYDERTMCSKCNELIGNKVNLNTIVVDPDSRVRRFCSIECFESQDNWPKKLVVGKKRKKINDIHN
jgi:hypothetical protein